MTVLARLKQLTANFTLNVWFEALIALMLIALGLGGLLLAMQSRPYLGDAATDLAAVPVRVITSPNVAALSLFIAALGLGTIGAAWLIVRLVHWRFFAPVIGRRVWRQAILIGVLVMVVAWLKVNEVLTLPLAVVVALALILIEVFLNVRAAPKSDEKS